jgi:hypothetical protein
MHSNQFAVLNNTAQTQRSETEIGLAMHGSVHWCEVVNWSTEVVEGQSRRHLDRLTVISTAGRFKPTQFQLAYQDLFTIRSYDI